MFFEFGYGSVVQIGRFVAGLPRALGWSGPQGATVAPPAQAPDVCPEVTLHFGPVEHTLLLAPVEANLVFWPVEVTLL